MPINFLAALAVGVANMVIGFLWYGPIFSKKWMKEVGLTEQEIGNGPGIGYFYTFLAALLMGAVTSALVNMLNVTDALHGVALGLLIGVGYVGTAFLTTYIFSKRSWSLYAIDAGYQILTITVAGLLATLIR